MDGGHEALGLRAGAPLLIGGESAGAQLCLAALLRVLDGDLLPRGRSFGAVNLVCVFLLRLLLSRRCQPRVRARAPLAMAVTPPRREATTSCVRGTRQPRVCGRARRAMAVTPPRCCEGNNLVRTARAPPAATLPPRGEGMTIRACHVTSLPPQVRHVRPGRRHAVAARVRAAARLQRRGARVVGPRRSSSAGRMTVTLRCSRKATYPSARHHHLE